MSWMWQIAWRLKGWLAVALGAAIIWILRWRHEAAEAQAQEAKSHAANLHLRLRTHAAQQTAMKQLQARQEQERRALRRAKRQGKRAGGLDEW